MTIVQALRANRNVYTNRNTNLAEKVELPHWTGIDYAKQMRLESEAFYTPDETLKGYVPGNADITSEIAKAIRTGYGIIDENGEVSLRFNYLNMSRPGFVSPLNFELKLNNLRALYDSYGSEANKYKSEFEAALDEITSDLRARGGAYITVDISGVADSIRSIFRGEQGKYSMSDISAMVILSEQRLIGEHISDPNEYVLGVLLGYEASAIMALRDNWRLTDKAVETIWNEFSAFVDEVIKRAKECVMRANQDPFRNRNRGYSPINSKIIYNAISVMLGALDSDSYNSGIRNSLAQLDEAYSKHVSAQAKAGVIDQRFSCASLYLHFGGSVGTIAGRNNAEWSIRSTHFAKYFNLPDFALRGNLFGKNSTLTQA